METHGSTEREINLIELFWSILLSWRQLICAGVVFAILLGGLKYVKDTRFYQAAQNVDIEEKEGELSNDEMQQVLEARNLTARIEEYQNYLEDSALMQINLYEKPVVELQYYVDSAYTFNYTQESQNDYTSDLMTLYCNYITSGEMSKAVIEAAGLSVNQADVSELWEISQGVSSISIKFTCPEKEKMDAAAKTIKSQLSNKEIEFQEVGAHELKLLGEFENVVVDNVLIDKKNAISNNIATINTQLNNLKVNLTEQQLALLENKEEEAGIGVETEIAKPGINLKYIILGAILGVFFACAYITCKMLFTAKLQNPEEIRILYNVRLLGEVYTQPKKKYFLPAVDDKLLSIKNRRKKKLTMQQQIKVVAANIVLSCKQQGIACIYMSGSEYESIDMEGLNMLKKELAAQNIQVKEGDNIFYDAESLKKGVEIGNIVFVEQVGQSIYDEISNELNLAEDQKSNILGVVVLM